MSWRCGQGMVTPLYVGIGDDKETRAGLTSWTMAMQCNVQMKGVMK